MIWVVVAAFTACVLILIALGVVVAVTHAARAVSDGVEVLRRQRMTVGVAWARTALAGLVHGHMPHWSWR